MSESGGTRRKIMDLAEDLLRAHGYNGFSYAHIAQKLGVKNAAIHYHFHGKEDLGVALLNRERRRFQKLTASPTLRELSSTKKLDWFFSIYHEYSKGGKRVCYIGAFEASYADLPDAIQIEIRALHDEMRTWLQGLLAEGREENHFDFRGEPAEKAVLIMTAVQGALQIARMGSPDHLTITIRQLKQDLGLDT